MHSMMHECITVKVGTNKKHVKHAKTGKFNEIRGKFCKTGGNVMIFAKTGEENLKF